MIDDVKIKQEARREISGAKPEVCIVVDCVSGDSAAVSPNYAPGLVRATVPRRRAVRAGDVRRESIVVLPTGFPTAATAPRTGGPSLIFIQ